MYQLTNSMSIRRIADGAFIPVEIQNVDYANYLKWLEEGNTPKPVDLPIPPSPLEKIRAAELAADDYMRKASRIATLESALDKAMLMPQAVGKTRVEVRALYRQLNNTFRAIDDLEIFCEAERKKII